MSANPHIAAVGRGLLFVVVTAFFALEGACLAASGVVMALVIGGWPFDTGPVAGAALAGAFVGPVLSWRLVQKGSRR